MMIMAKMIAYSLLVGFITMGFIWYGWGLAQNLKGLRNASMAAKAKATFEKALEEEEASAKPE